MLDRSNSAFVARRCYVRRMSTYPAAVAGESFANEDGSSRQAEIAKCSAGEPVLLIPDPENRYDARCIRVVSVRLVQIGNIAREAPWIADCMDEGKAVEATIRSIFAGDGGLLGVVLDVTV